ncbi:hypothetical protein ABZV58_28935 [Nocardia sp. NPDC004654]|uniref:hypothetical protein n=1 Tax=Nocardia sp. NPDC004654 TaxID=3154776 RepID=UPI0033A1E215
MALNRQPYYRREHAMTADTAARSRIWSLIGSQQLLSAVDLGPRAVKAIITTGARSVSYGRTHD